MRTDGNGNGSRRPQEIQAEIERTRQHMDGTLSAIEQRLTPGQLVDQGLSYLKNSGGAEFVGNLGDQAKQNPLPVALVGIGLAWLMATRRNPGTQPEYDSSGPGLGERASQAKAKVSQTASSVLDTTRQQVDRAKDGFDTLMREQPLALGAVGLAIGALAAAFAPRTSPEEQLAGKIDQMVDPQAGSPQPMTEERWREEQREQFVEGVKPYAERAQSEPPV